MSLSQSEICGDDNSSAVATCKRSLGNIFFCSLLSATTFLGQAQSQ